MGILIRHMNRSCALIISTVVLVTAVSLSAQWPAYVPPGTPKNADGKPNLDAPAPRMPDGKPDLSGIWNNAFFGVPPAAGRGRGGDSARGGGRQQGAPPAAPAAAPGGGRRGV